jgi:ribonuclease J
VVVTITCYGGVKEIGGNKILIQDKDTKLFLDFGAGFSEGTQFFSAGIEPRRVNGAGDYFEFGLLPEIPGLYSEDALQNTELKYSKPDVDAILLSHFHYDHMGRINLVDPEIPVWCGETTSFMSQASSESGGSPLDGHDIKTFRTGDRFRVGTVEVEPIHVDHSIPGAYGFILHTSEGAVAYTGDFRFHGPMGTMTEDFASESAKAKPVALLSEGTRVAKAERRREVSEVAVAREVTSILKKNGGMVFSSFRGNDTDRIVSFYDACESTGRRLVVSMKVALLLEQLGRDRRLKLPRVGRDVSVYVRRKGGGDYDDSDYYVWERKYLDDGLTAAEIRKKQSSIFLHLDQWYFPELIDIRPSKGGAYVHATTEAFNEEGEQDEAAIRNWVDYFAFSYHQIHASGHAPMDSVGELVSRIRARRVIPIHTERPDLFPSIAKGSKVSLPSRGRAIPVQ